MDLTRIKDLVPEHAKDLKLNLTSVLTPEGAPGLSHEQILATALACAVAARNETLLRELEAQIGGALDEARIKAARSAASIMGMNNVYYRFLHMVDNDEYRQMPAKLRMTVIGNPGVDKFEFELYCLAVSAINGCGACVSSHEKVVRQGGISAEGVQSAVRIASVIHGLAVALESYPGLEQGRKAA
jgi:alkyl hydroperoxide reductase subunit D